MAWTNAFDIGDCTLSVHKDGSATAMTPSEMTAAGVTLEADASGLVTLTAPAFGSAGGSYEVRVTPGFDTRDVPVRLTAMAQDIADPAMVGGPPPAGQWFPSWSPAPASYSGVYPNGDSTDQTTHEFTPEQAWTYAGVAFAQAGI